MQQNRAEAFGDRGERNVVDGHVELPAHLFDLGEWDAHRPITPHPGDRPHQ
jgi:hypothetical protein